MTYARDRHTLFCSYDFGIGEYLAGAGAASEGAAGAGVTDATLSSTAFAGQTASSAALGTESAAAGGAAGGTGLAISATGTGAQTYGAVMSANAQGRMARLQGQSQQLRAARERIQSIREARIKTAMITQAAANSGTTGASGPQGGAASVGSQLGGNLSFLNQQTAIGQGMTNAYASLASGEGMEAIGGGVTKVGGTIFANRDQINDIFRS